MEIQSNIQKSLKLYLNNFLVLFWACLITAFFSLVTFGILAGPLTGGVLVLCLKRLRGENGEFSEVFGHFDRFFQTLTVTLLFLAACCCFTWMIGMIPLLGLVLNIAVGPLLGLLYFLSIGFIIDQQMQPIDAILRSIDCFATEPVILWIYSLVTLILAGCGAVIFLIPIAVTMPLGVIGMAIAYQYLSTKETPLFKPGKAVLRFTGVVVALLLITGLVFMFFGFKPLIFKMPIWLCH